MDSNQKTQEYWFRRQIQLANELKMPIVIHSREADQKTLDILKEEGAFSDERCSWFPKRVGAGGVLEKDARVLLHCFSGSRELGQQYVKLEILVGVEGIFEDLAAARNTSVQVDLKSIAELENSFEEIKSAFDGLPFANRIQYKMNEHYNDENINPIDVIEILKQQVIYMKNV